MTSIVLDADRLMLQVVLRARRRWMQIGRALAALLLMTSFVAASLTIATSEDAAGAEIVAASSPAPATSPTALAVAPAQFGDLSHLSFTATHELHALLVDPKPDGASETSTTSIEVAVGLGQGAEVRVNGEIVPASRIGKRVIDPPAALTRYTYYGVALQPGPNRVAITPLGAGDLRGPAIEQTIYGPGKPALLEATFEGRAIADGRSTLTLRVTARDEWQHAAAPGSVVKVRIGSREARLVETLTPGRESKKTDDGTFAVTASGATPANFELVLGPGGTASAIFASGLKPGDFDVRVACDELEIDRRIFLAPNARVPMVVGLASVGIGSV